MDEIETWKQVEWAPKYFVSSLGRKRGPKGIKTPSINSRGYITTAISTHNGFVSVTIHKLVAEAFIGKIPKGFEVNHKNGIKTDNRVQNLEIISRKENLLHAYRIGLRKILSGGNGTNSKLTDRQAEEIRNSKVITWKLAEKYKVSRSAIRRIRSGESYKKPRGT